MHLYETHLPVEDTERALAFYRDVIGLEFAYRDPGRDIVFMWVGSKEQSMLGLWGPGTVHGKVPGKRHFAFSVTLPELTEAVNQLHERQILTHNFMGEETSEPSVIGWMPSAQIYFRDPDGHSLEYIALLDDPPDSSFIGSLSEWVLRSAKMS